MNHQEYSHINYLALDLLIDAKIDRLPVDVAEIASNHGISSIIDFSKSRYDNAVIVSKHILGKYGYNNNLYYSEYLATKILSPLIIFKELGINNFEHFHFAQFASTDCPFRMSGAGSSVEAVWVSG